MDHDQRFRREAVEAGGQRIRIGTDPVNLDPVALVDIRGSEKVEGSTSRESQVGPLRMKSLGVPVSGPARRWARAGNLTPASTVSDNEP